MGFPEPTKGFEPLACRLRGDVSDFFLLSKELLA
jgi:hypothetical protein